MTSGAPQTTDRVSFLEGAFSQVQDRLSDMNGRIDSLHSDIRSLRILMFTGMGIMWASMVAGFVAVFVAVSNIS